MSQGTRRPHTLAPWRKVVDIKYRLRCKKFCFYCIEDFSGSLEGARGTPLLRLAPKAVRASTVSPAKESGSLPS